MNDRGTTLCQRHARTFCRDRRLPSGPCDPASEWNAGDGVVRCDVIADPERVQAALVSMMTPSPHNRWGH